MVCLALRLPYFTVNVPVPNCGSTYCTPAVTAFTCGRSFIASASSKVSSLRVRNSSVGRPKVIGMWKAKMMFDPMLLIMLLTLLFRPRTIDEIPMTTATPMTMPSTVRPERILLLRMVASAIVMISPNSLFAHHISY